MVEDAPAPTWIEFTVLADAESVESVAELFRRYGHNEGVVIEEAYRQDEDGEHFQIDPTRPVAVRTYWPDDADAPGRRAALDEGLWHLRQLGVVGVPNERIIREDDWASAWKQHFPVLRIGRRFVIRPTWQEHVPEPGDLTIHLDPGMAFGTGLHPTTRGCLELLQEISPMPSRLIDVGCGSGILALAALGLGVEHADACDTDPLAVEATTANAAANGLADRTRAWRGTLPLIPPGDPYPLVLANLVAAVLVELAPRLAAHLSPGGTLLASGIIEPRAGDVLDAMAEAGLHGTGRRDDGEWVSLVIEHAT